MEEWDGIGDLGSRGGSSFGWWCDWGGGGFFVLLLVDLVGG